MLRFVYRWLVEVYCIYECRFCICIKVVYHSHVFLKNIILKNLGFSILVMGAYAVVYPPKLGRAFASETNNKSRQGKETDPKRWRYSTTVEFKLLNILQERQCDIWSGCKSSQGQAPYH